MIWIEFIKGKVCEQCAAWEGAVVRIFGSEAEFQASPHYGGEDRVINDPRASLAMWPGKHNVGRYAHKSPFWWICAPAHPNCGDGWSIVHEIEPEDWFKEIENMSIEEIDRSREAPVLSEFHVPA